MQDVVSKQETAELDAARNAAKKNAKKGGVSVFLESVPRVRCRDQGLGMIGFRPRRTPRREGCRSSWRACRGCVVV